MEQIYTLTDPTDNLIKYVGKSKNVNERFIRHCSPSNNSNGKEKQEWIKTLRKLGLKPKLEIIEHGDYNNENFWINQLRAWGFPLFNIHHNELHNRISKGKKGIKNSLQHIENTRKASSKGTYVAYRNGVIIETGIGLNQLSKKTGIGLSQIHRIFKSGEVKNEKSKYFGVCVVLIPK